MGFYIVKGRRGSGKTGYLAWQAMHDAERGRRVLANINIKDERIICDPNIVRWEDLLPEDMATWIPTTIIIDMVDFYDRPRVGKPFTFEGWLQRQPVIYTATECGAFTQPGIVDIYVSTAFPSYYSFARHADSHYLCEMGQGALTVTVQHPPDLAPHHRFSIPWDHIHPLYDSIEVIPDLRQP